MNLAEEIFRRAAPEAPAIFHGGRVVSYAELDALSADRARSIRQSADAAAIRIPRVGLEGHDSVDYTASALGILRAGGCFIPVATGLAAPEKENLLQSTRAHWVLHAADGSCPEAVHPFSDPPWQDAFESLNPAFVRFSSGTTGDAKGIVLSHETLLERVVAANAGMRIGPDDRVLWVLPMAHHFAASIMVYLFHGAAVILPEAPLAAGILDAGTKHRATVLYAAPFHLDLLARSGTGSLDSLRLAVSTTAPLRVETAERFSKRFGIAPCQALGIIEIGLPCINHDDRTGHPESVGLPQPGFEIEIRDEDGTPLARGKEGLLHIRGPGMLDAYLSPWKLRREILDVRGFFKTGDFAVMDEKGRLRILGRAAAVISTGGIKFFPEEVERILCGHPAVAAARVSGEPHALFGAVPKAEIQMCAGASAPTVAELREWCAQFLSHHKIPVRFEFVNGIPLTAGGKIRRV